MKRVGAVSGLISLENGVCKLELVQSSFTPSTSASTASMPNPSSPPPVISTIVEEIKSGTLETHPTKQDLTSRQVQSHVIYLQHKFSLVPGSQGGWNQLAEDALRQWLRTKRRAAKASSSKQVLAITDEPGRASSPEATTSSSYPGPGLSTQPLAIANEPSPPSATTHENAPHDTPPSPTGQGSSLLRAKLRSAQYEYWNRSKDLWLACGEMLPCHENKVLVVGFLRPQDMASR